MGGCLAELRDDGAVLDGAHFGDSAEGPSLPSSADERLAAALEASVSAALEASGDEVCLRLLRAELEAALRWFVDVTVQLTFYEGAALFLGEPRQREKLVRYVVEQARSFRESDRLERQLRWQDHPSLIAAESLRLERTLGAELRVASVQDEVPVPSSSTVSPVLAITPRSDTTRAEGTGLVKAQ